LSESEASERCQKNDTAADKLAASEYRSMMNLLPLAFYRKRGVELALVRDQSNILLRVSRDRFSTSGNPSGRFPAR
jgi:hypothetical protein